MLHETIRLREVFPALPETETDVVLKSYARAREDSPRTLPRGAVIVLHGGGYFMKSITEYEPVALRFMAEGYQAFTLDYSLLPARYPQQLQELAAAVAYLRDNAVRYGIDANSIALCGFSAGAHLAATLANSWNDPRLFEPLGLTCEQVQPNAVILSYPPATSDLPDCRQMFANLMGDRDDDETLRRISPIHTLNADTPPVFLWQTFSDEMVSVRHSLLLAEAMHAKNLPFELHIFPDGPHAMALCDLETAFTSNHYQPYAAKWFDLAVKWLKLTML